MFVEPAGSFARGVLYLALALLCLGVIAATPALAGSNGGGTRDGASLGGGQSAAPQDVSSTSCPNAQLRSGLSRDLPDCRAYELVSPTEKNGGDVMPDSARVRAAAGQDAANPMAVAFASLTGFGDVAGTGIATDYMSVRDGSSGTSGWRTHALTPPQRSLSYFAAARGQDPSYDSVFSPDLGTGIFRAWSLLAPAPNAENVENLYLRNDLRSPGAGSYQLLTDPAGPVGIPGNSVQAAQINVALVPVMAGNSADFGHVIFESRDNLTGEAPASLSFQGWLWEWDHGTLRLAGILPDGSPAPTSNAGQSSLASLEPENTISSDGRRIFFTVTDGSCGTACGAIYMRLDHTSTVQLNASERTTCADQDPCDSSPEPDPNGTQPATFWTASTDGSRVFFTTTEALTDDAPVNNDRKLYVYDTSKPDSDPHNLRLVNKARQVVPANDVRGAIGASADGSYVYFVSSGQLVSGGPDLQNGDGIFVWHDDATPDGHLAYVGRIDPNDDIENVPGNFALNPLRARVTPDGKRLLFSTSTGTGLVGYDHGSCPENGTSSGGCRELYVYDATSGTLRCASCNPTGAPGTTDAYVGVRSLATGGAITSIRLNHAISDDGSRVFFSTGEALVPQDVNGRADVYEYDVPSGSVHLISSGRSTSDSYFMDASANGDDVFFTTRQALTGWDTDGNTDLYDARVDGGVPDPAAPPPGCSGDTCQAGSATGGLGLLAPGSVAIDGSDNVANPHVVKRKPLKCKRGYVRKKVRGKVRCVRHPRPRVKKSNGSNVQKGSR
jgi:hypothetical protein